MSEEILEINKEHVVHDSFEGETVIINFNTGRYFSLSGSAPFIWEMLQHSSTKHNLSSALVARYGIGEEAALQAAEAFIGKIVAEQLVLVKDGQSTSNAMNAVGDGPAEPFELPDIVVFNDLEGLIGLDPIHEAAPDLGWPVRLPSEHEDDD